MKELIEFMARAIVENPDAVEVTEEDGGDHFVYYLKVADEDMGRVIGKQGRIANAMRTMLKVAAIRRGVRAVLEIGDARGGRGGQGRGGYSDRAEYDRGTSDDEDAGYEESHLDTGDEADTGYNEPREDDGGVRDEDDAQPESHHDEGGEHRDDQ